jgi:hypothetical protein
MVSRSTTATIARRKKATLKMAAREREIIGGVWGERERGRSSGSDGAEAFRLEERGERNEELKSLRERERERERERGERRALPALFIS